MAFAHGEKGEKMRLVDADKLAERVANLEAVALEQVEKLEPNDEHEKWKVWSAILNERTAFKFDLFDAPTVDAVEVVRCKDCKWYEESKHSELRPNRFCYRLRNDNGVPVGYNWDSDDFCSYGERREDGKID